MTFKILIEPAAVQDIQKAITYYDEQQVGLGTKFESALNRHLISIKKNPFFQIRYDNVHCLPVKKYPFMIHFVINEADKAIIIVAVLHTSQDPKKWKRD